MLISKTLSFYKRQDIQNELIKQAQDKEVAIRFRNKGFGKRPDILKYENDILEFAKKGGSSFHASEELWRNPLQLNPNLKREDLDQLRTGWDLVLDIDCKFFEYSKLAAHYTALALKHMGVDAITCKFSGNKGFHLAVPFEAFPDRVGSVETRLLFPEAPRRIAAYITYLIKEPLENGIMKLENENFNNIFNKVKTEVKLSSSDEIIRKEIDGRGEVIKQTLRVDPFLDIDTILISSRHLYRMPYSFHEKSELISIPVDPMKVLDFKKEAAEPENVKIAHTFLNRDIERGQASKLLIQAFDFEPLDSEDSSKKRDFDREFEDFKEAVPEDFFPPCIINILKGLEDGRKRAVFVLINFLANLGWSYEKIDEKLRDWNKKNFEPLRERDIVGPIRYRKFQGKIAPPNCGRKEYYSAIGACKPDSLCSRIRNPLQYARRKAFSSRKPQSRKLSEEEKLRRRREREKQKAFKEKMLKSKKQE